LILKRKKELHRSFECAIQITYFCTLFWGVQFLLMGVQRKMQFGCIGRALYHSSQSFPFLNHEKTWIRREAKKAISKLEK